MKNLLVVSILLILYMSCSGIKTESKQSHSPESNDIQNNFIALVSAQADSIYNATKISNPMKKESEYSKAHYNFNYSINSFLYQNQLFENFTGIINNIRYEKGKKYSFIYFTLLIKYRNNNSPKHISHMRNALNCIHTVLNTHKTTDSIFINLQNLDNNNRVYFNGFINKNMNGNVSISPESSVDGHLTGFNFTILNISKNKLNNHFSSNLKNAVNVKFKELEILGQCMLRDENEIILKKRTSYLKLDSIMNTLNNNEKEYIAKIQNTYTSNLIKEYSYKNYSGNVN